MKTNHSNIFMLYCQFTKIWQCIKTKNCALHFEFSKHLLLCKYTNLCTHAHLVIVSYQWALTLTWVHLAYLLYERLIKACNYSTTYWNHKVLVQALYKGIDSSHTRALMTDNPRKSHRSIQRWAPDQLATCTVQWRVLIPAEWGACIWTTVHHMHC